jgi:hypothetical protein
MSSSEFEVDLDVDSRCRHFVLASGLLLGLSGAAIIFFVNLPAVARGVLFLLWTIECGRELRNCLAGMRRVCALRLSSSGQLRIADSNGRLESAELETGTMVLGTLAWVRVRFADGCRHGELLSAHRSEGRAWHRFQLIWRLSREAFGHPGRA